MSDENFIERSEDGDDESPGFVARGDNFLDEGDESALPSELPGVSDDRWTQFVRAMMTSKVDAVSPSNAVGIFEIMPRRLADLGVVKRLTRKRSPANRVVYVAVFVPPMTSERFLRSPQAQYQVFCNSMRNYDDSMTSGEIKRDPTMSRSGALAILHRCGPRGLDTWKSGEQFDRTKQAYESVAGVF